MAASASYAAPPQALALAAAELGALSASRPSSFARPLVGGAPLARPLVAGRRRGCRAQAQELGEDKRRLHKSQDLGQELKQDMMGGHRDSEDIGIPTEAKLIEVLGEGTDASARKKGEEGVVKELASESAVEGAEQLMEDARRGAQDLFGGDTSPGHKDAGRAAQHLEQEADYMSGEASQKAASANSAPGVDLGTAARETVTSIANAVSSVAGSLGEELQGGGQGLAEDLVGKRRGSGNLAINTEDEVTKEVEKDAGKAK